MMATHPDPSPPMGPARGATPASTSPSREGANGAARRWCGAYLLVGVLGTPALASAASTEAEELFERGLEHMKAGSVERGCDLIEQSHELDPLPGALFTLAECRARAGQDVQAWTRFRQFLAQVHDDAPEGASPHAARIEAARRRLLEIEARVARVTLILPLHDEAAPLQLFVDGVARAIEPSSGHEPAGEPGGEPVDEAALGARPRQELAFAPGQHTFRLASSDGAEERIEVSLGAGEARTLQLARPRRAVVPPAARDQLPGPPAPGAAEEAKDVEEPAVTQGRPSGPGLWTYTAFGVGAAGLVTGSIAGAVLISRKNTVDRYCTGEVCEEPGYRATRGIDTLDTVANVGFAVGALGVGVGLWLAFGAADDAETQSATRLQVGIDGNRALLRGTW